MMLTGLAEHTARPARRAALAPAAVTPSSDAGRLARAGNTRVIGSSARRRTVLPWAERFACPDLTPQPDARHTDLIRGQRFDAGANTAVGATSALPDGN